jgi:hypothetical protein
MKSTFSNEFTLEMYTAGTGDDDDQLPSRETLSEHLVDGIIFLQTTIDQFLVSRNFRGGEMALIASLESDLRMLAAEARRKFPAIKNAADRSIFKA